jgi:3-mercaptopyruvate sulfurtransferase SseA
MSPIIEVEELLALTGRSQVLLFDAGNGAAARANYEKEHLRGAIFVDMDTELSGPKNDISVGGRHPLPDKDAFAATLTRLGVSKNSHIVIYDDKNGANAAARFWWMLKAAGHENVQVLNGGFQEAKKMGFPMESGLGFEAKKTAGVAEISPIGLLTSTSVTSTKNASTDSPIMGEAGSSSGQQASESTESGELTQISAIPEAMDEGSSATDTSTKQPYTIHDWKLPLAHIDEVEAAAKAEGRIVIDVRSKERYDGITEPLDPVAGHIPGAINIPFTENLDNDGLFIQAQELRQKYSAATHEMKSSDIIVHCGSGVTACHTILAMAYAGFDIPKLYVGSWSEWCRSGKNIGTNHLKHR